jgi:hypothetical protein
MNTSIVIYEINKQTGQQKDGSLYSAENESIFELFKDIETQKDSFSPDLNYLANGRTIKYQGDNYKVVNSVLKSYPDIDELQIKVLVEKE